MQKKKALLFPLGGLLSHIQKRRSIEFGEWTKVCIITWNDFNALSGFVLPLFGFVLHIIINFLIIIRKYRDNLKVYDLITKYKSNRLKVHNCI